MTKKDFVIETMRGSGPGGQHRNKTDSAVRIKHPPSGAEAQSQDQRSQHANKKIAFRRLAESKKFKKWLHIDISRTNHNIETIEREVEKQLDPQNIKVEILKDGRWGEE